MKHFFSYLLVATLPIAFSFSADSPHSHHRKDSGKTPETEEACKFYASGDFIVWRVDEGGMAFVQGNSFPMELTNPATDSTLPKGTTFTATNSGNDFISSASTFQGGFRVGAGVVTNYDKWDLGAMYTRFHTGTFGNNSLGSNLAGNTLTLPTFNLNLGSAINQFVQVVDSQLDWSYDYDVVDLMLSRAMQATKHISLTPKVGFKGSWQKRKYNATYLMDEVSGPDLEGTEYIINQTQKFWGVGPSLGIDGTWQLYKGFGLVASLDTALLWSQFQSHRVDTATVLFNLAEIFSKRSDFQLSASNS